MKEYLPKRRILIYGPPKSGKSEKLARVPKGSRMYAIDADRQLGSFVALWRKVHGDLKNLEVVSVPDAGEKNPGDFQFIRKLLWNPPAGFHYYLLDSYTKILLNLTHSICGKGERNYNMFNNQKLSSAANDFWFQFVSRVEAIAPEAWVITVMHEQWKEVDDGTITDKNKLPAIIVPKCGTSAEVTIPGACDFVWHAEKGRNVIGGVNRSETFYRTRGNQTIMASSVGFEGILKDSEPADLGAILGTMGLLPNLKSPTTKTLTFKPKPGVKA